MEYMHYAPREYTLNEAYDPDAPKVSLYVGRFQPFTLGHLKCVMRLRDEYGVPVLICAIPVTEEKADETHPFYGQLQDEMYNRLNTGLNNEYPGLIAGVTYVPNAYIGNTIDVAKNMGFQPIGWGCGTDRYEVRKIGRNGKERIEGYKPMHDKFMAHQAEIDPEERNIDPDNFNLIHIKRDIAGNGDDLVSKISGSGVRKAIINGDRETFERMMPQCLHSLFNAFRKALYAIYGEPAIQGIKEIKDKPKTMKKKIALNEDSIKRIIKQTLNEALAGNPAEESPWVYIADYIERLYQLLPYAKNRAQNTEVVSPGQFDATENMIHTYADAILNLLNQMREKRGANMKTIHNQPPRGLSTISN